MDRIDMIFDMLKSLDGKTDDIVESQLRVEADLKYHIKRTDLLEKKVKGVITWKHIAKLVAVIASIATILKATGVI